jgi:hypothetical protein
MIRLDAGRVLLIAGRAARHVDCCCPCCERKIPVCIDENVQSLPANGGSYTWDVAECCGCPGATFKIETACVDGVVTASWTYQCGAFIATGTLDWSDFCTEDAVIVDDVEVGSCTVSMRVGTVTACTGCPEADPCDCCLSYSGWGGVYDPGGQENNIGTISSYVTPTLVCTGQYFLLSFTVQHNAGGGAWTGDSTAAGAYFAIQELGSADVAIISQTPPFDFLSGPGGYPGWNLSLAEGATATFSVLMQLNDCGGGIVIEHTVDRGYRTDSALGVVPCTECCECTAPGVQDDDDGGNTAGVTFSSYPILVCRGGSYWLEFRDQSQWGADTLITGSFTNVNVTVTDDGGGTLTGGDGTNGSFSIDFGTSAVRRLSVGISFSGGTGCISGNVIGGIFASDGRTRVDYASDTC